MSRTPALLLCLLPLLSACGRCGRVERAAEGPGALAVVNGEPVTAEALRRELASGRAGLPAAPGGDAGAEALAGPLRRLLLDGAIDRRLLLQQARARGITAPPEQVERAFLRLRAEYPGTHFDDLLAQEKLSAAELRARLQEQLTVERLFAEELFPRLEVPEEEAVRWYDAHAAEFDEPERVRARQILVRTREEAVRVREEVRRRPQTFGDVARRASIAPEGRTGGDLGLFARDGGMPEVFEACFKLAPNQVSEVVPSPYGFHLFQVTERRPAGRRTFAEARDAIRQRLLREKRARAQEELVLALRQKAKITVDAKALEALAP